MRMLGHVGKVDVKPLSKQAAVEMGSELIGEVVLFSIAIGTLSLELSRSHRNDRLKEEEQNAKLLMLQEQITEQNVQMREVLRLLHSVDEKLGVLSFGLQNVREVDEDKE